MNGELCQVTHRSMAEADSAHKRSTPTARPRRARPRPVSVEGTNRSRCVRRLPSSLIYPVPARRSPSRGQAQVPRRESESSRLAREADGKTLVGAFEATLPAGDPELGAVLAALARDRISRLTSTTTISQSACFVASFKVRRTPAAGALRWKRVRRF
jgi:hypothetical protein